MDNPPDQSEPATDEGDETDILGVSVYHLRKVFLETRVSGAKNQKGEYLSRSSKIYDIEDLRENDAGIIRKYSKLDARTGSSYVHSLVGADHVGKATLMLSYCWG